MSENKHEGLYKALKVTLIVIGAFAALAGIGVLLCRLFKKYFTIQIECGNDCEECPDAEFEDDEVVEPEIVEPDADDAEAPAEA